jgi:hypothetical protein
MNNEDHSRDNDVVFEPLLARGVGLLVRAVRKLLRRP